jgi:hypothetical protein
MDISEESEKLGPKEAVVTLEVEVPADHVTVKKKTERRASKAKQEAPKPEDMQLQKIEQKPEDNSGIIIGGKSLEEFLKSPVEALPQDASPDEPKATQKEVIIIGVAVIVLSFIAWPVFNFGTALALVFAGMILVIGGTFVRV